jgi:CheY-like chemotaxis protein
MKTILLVEEDPLQAMRWMSFLEKRFRRVRRVADPVDAFCLIEQPAFSQNLGLVVTAHHLPGLSGPAFVDELLARKPALPVLVLGATPESMREYASAGVRLLSKPISEEQLTAVISQMLHGGAHKAA